MKKVKKAVVLINLGTPKSTSIPDVKEYLDEFLMDEYVIDVPYLLRALIVKGFILRKRPAQSAEAYESIWWDEGSPLMVISDHLTQKVDKKVDVPVVLAMRYGQPSIKSVFEELKANYSDLEEVLCVPLYPQYAMATTKTVEEEVKRVTSKWSDVVVSFKSPFYNDEDYIKAQSEVIKPYLNNYDHILFSYHGLPERHLKKTDPTGKHCLKVENCCSVNSEAHTVCYRHQVYEATNAVVEKLSIPNEKYTISFQSRLGQDKWIKPFTEETLAALGQKGIKRLLVSCPAFVADCIETLEEIGMRGKEVFIKNGGESFEMIPCINDSELWVNTVVKWVDDFIIE